MAATPVLAAVIAYRVVMVALAGIGPWVRPLLSATALARVTLQAAAESLVDGVAMQLPAVTVASAEAHTTVVDDDTAFDV